jgi:cytochrome P450 family 135
MSDTFPPGPPLPAVVQTLAWGVRPVAFFERCRRRYGPTFTMRFYDGRPVVVVSRPEDVRALFALSADQFVTGADNADILEPFLGRRSVLALDGDAHRDERRRVQRVFRTERVETYQRLVAEETTAEMTRWRPGMIVALHDATRAITLEVILRAVFGAEEEGELTRLRAALGTFLAESSASPLVLLPMFRRDLGPRSPWGRFVRQRAAVHAEILALVGHRRGQSGLGERTDMLSALVETVDDDGLILDELMTLVLAGHDTTATGLAWAFDLLLHHPAAMDRLRASLAAGDDAYLDATVHEALRLRPVVGETGRRPLQPFPCSAGELPAGTGVVASFYLAHTDPDRYPDPFAFRPERFLETPPDLATWLPFGGGVRRCLGAGFATLEMKEVLRTVLSGADLRPASPEMERPKRRAVTLIPRHGTQAVVVDVDASDVRPVADLSSRRPAARSLRPPTTRGQRGFLRPPPRRHPTPA